MRTPRVLIADDLDTQRDLLRAALRNAPFRVEFAEDGEIAVRMVREACASGDEYDLILLDGAMPNLSGLGAAEQMMRDNAGCGFKIYFLTNLDRDDPTLNLRIRLMNLDPTVHLLIKNDVITKLAEVVCGIIECVKGQDDAKGKGDSHDGGGPDRERPAR